MSTRRASSVCALRRQSAKPDLKASGELVEVDYLLRQNGQFCLISDLYLNGVISEAATRRSEVVAILRSGGIAALDRKARG
jgi:hypothetical protein